LPRDIQDIIRDHGHDVFLVAAEMSVRSDLQFTNSLKNQSIMHVCTLTENMLQTMHPTSI